MNMRTDIKMSSGSVFLAITVALCIWYLIEYSFMYDSNNCVDKIENDASCQKQATYIAFLVVAVILGGSALGLFASIRFPMMFGKKKRKY